MEYLSEAWFLAADRALRSAERPAPLRLVIDQNVTGRERWRVVLDPAGSRIERPPESPSSADGSFEQSLTTAAAIARGELDAHAAFLLGEISYRGDIEVLIDARPALDWLETQLAPVMAKTVWPAGA